MNRKEKIKIANDLIDAKNLEKVAKNLYKNSLARYSKLLYGSTTKMQDKQTLHYEQEAQPIVDNYEKKFDELNQRVKSLIHIYDTTVTYNDNIDLLKSSYSVQNDKIKSEIDKRITKNLTDERKHITNQMH